jgi:hypothetical protein
MNRDKITYGHVTIDKRANLLALQKNFRLTYNTELGLRRGLTEIFDLSTDHFKL